MNSPVFSIRSITSPGRSRPWQRIGNAPRLLVDWHSRSIGIELEFRAGPAALIELAGDRAWLPNNNAVVSSSIQRLECNGDRDRVQHDSRSVINTNFYRDHVAYSRCHAASHKHEKRNAYQLFTGRRVPDCHHRRRPIGRAVR